MKIAVAIGNPYVIRHYGSPASVAPGRDVAPFPPKYYH
jgi:hypothetical protein